MPEVYSGIDYSKYLAPQILAAAWKRTKGNPKKQADVILAAVRCVLESRRFYKYRSGLTAQTLMQVRRAALLLRAGMQRAALEKAEREYKRRELTLTTLDTGPRYAAVMLLRMFFAEESILPATLEAALHCCLWQLPAEKQDRLAEKMLRVVRRLSA